jgi:thermostable 8-oxoguanine DNA glycosylase
MAETLTPKEGLCATEALGLKTPEELARLAEQDDDFVCSISNIRNTAFTVETLELLTNCVVTSVQGVTALAPPTGPAIHRLCEGLIQMRDNKACMQDKFAKLDKTLVAHYAFTLLVPGGRADKAAAVVKQLITDYDVFALCQVDTAAESILNLKVLEELFSSRIRFPRQKAENFVLAMRRWPEVVAVCQSNLDADTAHKRLVALVPGFGPKAAAHFMRNIGVHNVDGDAVAIVDTHIQKFVDMLQVNAPKRRYGKDSVAVAFTLWCKNSGYPLLLADAVVWMMYSRTQADNMVDFGGFNV